jgi:hypothetical protein
MERMIRETPLRIVVIGSYQQGSAPTVSWLKQQVDLLFGDNTFLVSAIIDPSPISGWPVEMEKAVRSKFPSLEQAGRILYRSDRDIDPEAERDLRGLGYEIRFVRRRRFFVMCPDGFYRKAHSATEVKELLAAQKEGGPTAHRTSMEIMAEMKRRLREVPYGGAYSSDEKRVLDIKLQALEEMKMNEDEKRFIRRELEDDFRHYGFT